MNVTFNWQSSIVGTYDQFELDVFQIDSLNLVLVIFFFLRKVKFKGPTLTFPLIYICV